MVFVAQLLPSLMELPQPAQMCKDKRFPRDVVTSKTVGRLTNFKAELEKSEETRFVEVFLQQRTSAYIRFVGLRVVTATAELSAWRINWVP